MLPVTRRFQHAKCRTLLRYSLPPSLHCKRLGLNASPIMAMRISYIHNVAPRSIPLAISGHG